MIVSSVKWSLEEERGIAVPSVLKVAIPGLVARWPNPDLSQL